MARIRRTEQCLSASPSSSTPLENHQGIAMGTSASTNAITALSTSNDHVNESQPQLLGTGIDTIDELPMDGWGPVMHHHTRKKTLLPDKGTIKAPEVAMPLKEQACSLIHDILKPLTKGRLFSKIGIQWKHKNKGQCKDMLQITLEICIPQKEHLGTLDMPSHLKKATWHNLNRALQRHLKDNSDHQDEPTMVPNRTKWHQQIY
jgi:hypothetical protein